MSRFSRNLLDGFQIGSAIRRQKKVDEIYEFNKEKRDRERAGNKEWDSFLSDQYSTPDTVALVSPMAAGIRDNPNNQNVVAHPLKDKPTNAVAGGVTPAPNQPPQQQSNFNVPDLQTAQKEIYRASQMAAKYPSLAGRYQAWKPAYSQAAMHKYQQDFKGDLNTPKGIEDYYAHMAKGAAAMGDIIQPEEAKQRYDSIQNLKAEGYTKALNLFHNNDSSAALKAWNSSGKKRATFVSSTPEPFTLGGVSLPGNRVELIDENGQPVSINTGQAKFQAMTYEKQITAMMSANRDKISSKKVVAGEDDNYLVDVLKGEAKALKTGAKKTGSSSGRRDGYGRSNSDVMALKKNATSTFDKSINVSKGQFGLQGLKKEDGKLYSATTKYMYSLIERFGVNDGDAADLGKDFAERAWKHRDNGEVNYIQKTQREIEAMAKKGLGKKYKSLWSE